MALKLYTSEVCPYAQRTRIVLAEKNIAHDCVEIDINDKPEWFAKLTPAGRVPVIDHDGFVLWESATVNEYLDAAFDGPTLMPTTEREKAVLRNEIRHFDTNFLVDLYKLLFTQDSAGQHEMRDVVDRAFGFLELRLRAISADGPFWMGPIVTLADCAMFPFFERLEVFEHYRGLTLPAECGRLRQWFEAVTQRPAFRSSMHDLDYFIPQYAAYANDAGQGLSAQAFRSGRVN